MARRRSYHRKRRQGRFSFLYKILIFVAICGAIAVALALFFKVDTITVTGNSRYTANQIIEASGIETGDNMFFLNKYHASERITAALPYVETVRISRQLPDTLVVTVTECTAPAAVSQDGKLWLLSGDGKIVDAKTGDGKQYAVVEGLTLLLHQNLPQVEIMTADNGRSALAVLRERGAEPDLLITDLNMPLMDGIELSQQIRRRYPRCRIMIISGYEDFEAARSAIELGALRYMLKPINHTEMVAYVRSVLEDVVREQDERNQYLHDKSGGAALDILLVLLLFSTVTAALFSMAAFSAVFPLLLAALAIKGGLYALYSRACA